MSDGVYDLPEEPRKRRTPGARPRRTAAAMTARHRTGLFDGAFKHVIDWGLGFIINSNQLLTFTHYSFFHNSPSRPILN